MRGRNGQIYSIHAPGVSTLVAPVFALAGYHGVVVFLLILSGITAALAWDLAFLGTGRTDAACSGGPSPGRWKASVDAHRPLVNCRVSAVSRTNLSCWRSTLHTRVDWTRRARLAIDVRAIMVRVDEDARRNVQGMTIEPVRIVAPSDRLTADYARRAVHYPGAIAYFMDERSFPEPEAFWVGGARKTSVVLQPDEPSGTARLQLRNGAVENTVMVQAGGWRDGLRLGPGEERQIQIPLDYARGATLLRFTTTAGFRPSEVDPTSRDDRFLGVWVKIVN